MKHDNEILKESLLQHTMDFSVSRQIDIVAPQLKKKMEDYRMRLAAINAGYSVITDWHPTIPEDWGKYPQLPFERQVIYRGNPDTWAYSHHQTILKFGKTYVASWSNGFLHEDYVGQEVHFAFSEDGINWSEPQIIAPTPLESQLVRNNAGLYVADGKLYCYVGVANDYGRDTSLPGMNSHHDQHASLDVYETTDMKNWRHHKDICKNVVVYESPRSTNDGKVMVCGCDPNYTQAFVLIWDDPTCPASPPKIVEIPKSPEGVKPLEGSWYQTEDNCIWLYQRDESISCRLALTCSSDGGYSWSPMFRTDFHNSTSRVFAGRLTDGRYYIVGNNYDIFLDRMHLLIALSDDGRKFDRQYTLVEGPTTRRINGRHKENGYHYPNCFVDGDRLFVVYSVNKEDIEVGFADMSRVN